MTLNNYKKYYKTYNFKQFDEFGNKCTNECNFVRPKIPKKILQSLKKSLNTKLNKKLIRETRFKNIKKKFISLIITCILLFAIIEIYKWRKNLWIRTTIIIVTPTHSRHERYADMTRLSQTLMHVPDIHWIVIEDGNQTNGGVEKILQRSKIPFKYFNTVKSPALPNNTRGWTQRNLGLEYIRKNYKEYNYNAVIYFADDDNSYDIRLFEYIRKVKKIGVWAVGLAGAAKVEAPRVQNNKVIGWDVIFHPKRVFATDMAGFAVNLKLILNNTASFSLACVNKSPETCFLEQFGRRPNESEPFGHNEIPKDILVWHTKTSKLKVGGNNYGYLTE